jgi:hypothetical protein
LRGETLSGAITWEQILFFFGLLSLVAGIWWRVEGKIDKGKLESSTVAAAANALASLARQELADHRLHCAETYITKAGMRESTELIMEALQGVKQAVDHMALRVDRVVENQAAKPRAARGA